MYSKPLIGVSADRRVLDPHPFQMAGEKYLDALTKGSDAVPLIIPLMPDDVDVDELLATFDGLFLTGSSYRGISVNACLKEAETVASRVLAHLTGRPAAAAPEVRQ